MNEDKAIKICLSAIVFVIPLVLIVVGLVASGYVMGAKIIIDCAVIGYPILAILLLTSIDRVENPEQR